MGILAVRLQDECGTVLEEVGDPQNRLALLLPEPDDRSYACWRFIDPYGDTVFNTLQMPDFLAELERLKTTGAADEADRHLLDAVRALAERCRDGVHLYLKFLGD